MKTDDDIDMDRKFGGVLPEEDETAIGEVEEPDDDVVEDAPWTDDDAGVDDGDPALDEEI